MASIIANTYEKFKNFKKKVKVKVKVKVNIVKFKLKK